MNMDWPSAGSGDDPVLLRGMKRDSMFLKASIHCRRTDHRFDIVVRNVSAGGLLADTPQELTNDDPVVVTLRNVGDVPGRVVWVQGGRFGIAFDVVIDPQLVRTPVKAPKSAASASPSRTTAFLSQRGGLPIGRR